MTRLYIALYNNSENIIIVQTSDDTACTIYRWCNLANATRCFKSVNTLCGFACFFNDYRLPYESSKRPTLKSPTNLPHGRPGRQPNTTFACNRLSTSRHGRQSARYSPQVEYEEAVGIMQVQYSWWVVLPFSDRHNTSTRTNVWENMHSIILEWATIKVNWHSLTELFCLRAII